MCKVWLLSILSALELQYLRVYTAFQGKDDSGVGVMQLINSDSALDQMPHRDHKTRRTIAESLSYMPMLLPTLLATAGLVWDLGLLPSDSLRDPSSVQTLRCRARACHKLFHNIQTGLVMDQMNI